MPDRDASTSYREAVANLRDTTKWIISSFAALAALLIGTSPLNGLGALPAFTYRWYVAGGSSLFGLALTTLILALALRVMSSSGIDFNALVHGRRYRRHREDMDRQHMIALPTGIATLAELEIALNNDTIEFKRNRDEIVGNRVTLYRENVTLALVIARWLEVSYRFRTLIRFMLAVLFPILASVYVFVWAANPQKEKPAAAAPVQLTVLVSPAMPAPNSPSVPSGVVLDCGQKDKPIAVGPFVPGYVTLEPGAADVNSAMKSLEARRGKRVLVGLVLIGSTDKTLLKPEFARQFGSNTGLAQARAEWVRQQLPGSSAWSELQLDDPSKIVALVAGPAQVGSEVSSQSLALDRKVQVCALWTTAPGSVP